MSQTYVRCRVVALTVLLAMVTYLDRVCIAKLAPEIMRDLGLSTIQMGWLIIDPQRPLFDAPDHNRTRPVPAAVPSGATS